MGHDITGYDKKDNQICYIRFTMSDRMADEFYDFFSAAEYNGIYSGIGEVVSYTVKEVEKSLEKYRSIYPTETNSVQDLADDFELWQQNEMLDFILACLDTAEQEGCVNIAYG